MYAIFKKEIQSFLATPLGYGIIGSFLLGAGLVLWVFRGDFNLLDYGFADLSPFFALAPWIFAVLIPALTMKSFAEERKMGTLELLWIKPIPLWQLVLGKFLGAFALCVLTIAPTLIYAYILSDLSITTENYDLGILISSYTGLLFLVAAYTSIGIFASTLTSQQITAFIAGVLLCFFFYQGFDAIATLFADGVLQQHIQAWGGNAHFDSIARGVIDTRDLVYFVSVTLCFLYLTEQRLKRISQ